MKTIAFILSVLILAFPFHSFSQDVENRVSYDKNQMPDEAYRILRQNRNTSNTRERLEKLKSRLEAMVNPNLPSLTLEEREKMWMDYIKSIPADKLPYYAPSLYTKGYVPESILEQPLLKQFKGKLPTDIAPEVKDIVEKYGENISPDLYYLLIPETYEAFHQIEKNEKAIEHTDTPPTIEIRAKTEEEIKQIFISAESLKKSPDITDLIDINDPFIQGAFNRERNKKITSETKLTNQDVLDFISTIPDVRMIVESKQGIADMTKTLSIQDDNACARFLKRIEAAGYTEKIAETVKNKNFDMKSWGNICVRVFAASNYGELDLNKLKMIQARKQLTSIIGPTETTYKVDIDDFKAIYPLRELLHLSLVKDLFIIGSKDTKYLTSDLSIQNNNP